MKSTRSHLIALLIVLCVLMPVCDRLSAREVRCKLLQQKLGRLFFSAGKEEDIFPGCRWVVYRDSTDTLNPLLRGKIAESYDGVSVSDSGVPLTAETGFAVVNAADRECSEIFFVSSIDYTAEAITNSFEWESWVDVAPDKSEEEWGSRYSLQRQIIVDRAPECKEPSGRDSGLVTVSPRTFAHGRRISLKDRQTDGYISYRPLDCEPGEYHLSLPAPFVVVLLPNPKSPVNRNGLLTTALRYRIDSARLNDVFEYEAVPQQSFLPVEYAQPSYPPDRDKGKSLLKSGRANTRTVSIFPYSPTLRSTCRFLQGTLEQAGYTTRLGKWGFNIDTSDIRLSIVPYSTDSLAWALERVCWELIFDTAANNPLNQPLRLAATLLADAENTSDSTQRLRLYQRVDRILQEDVGAFPLFRPIIHVCAKDDIRGLRFDKDGLLDLSNVYRIKLPTDSSETSP